MCCVIAYQAKVVQSEHLDLFRNLCREGRARGEHAFGFAYASVGGIVEAERFTDFAAGLARLPSLFALEGPLRILAHTRYSTSGDWRDPENNQPLQLDAGGPALVFNGCIHMGTKAEREQKFAMKLTTDNDGEVLLRLRDAGTDLAAYVAGQAFSCAAALLDSKGLSLFRNANRPLWALEHAGARWAASTRDVFRRASFSSERAKEVPVGKTTLWR